jgi:formylglycine-generating enzyme required for sulfatase activity
MKRRKKILAGLALIGCVAVVWFALWWIKRPEMRPDYTVDLGNGVTLEMVWVPSGAFEMGSGPTTWERLKKTVSGWFGKTINLPSGGVESPAHAVTLDGFWTGKYEVTQAQYEAIAGKNPSKFKGSNNPVEQVSWNDATEFCRRLSAKTGKTFTLPTEAQWECACRAGSTGEFCFGDDTSELGDYAWHSRNSGGQTHPVGRKKPNAWGLYDMHGNVWEWCQDSYGGYKSGSQKNPIGTGGNIRVLRGGSWFNLPGRCRSARRFSHRPDLAYYGLGFRIVRTQK